MSDKSSTDTPGTDDARTGECFYITTPIYYVNDRPHIGHVYTSTVADILARFQRLRGRDVFFLTGTDEHAAKVVDAAAERGLSAQAWADQNAAAFQDAFRSLGLGYDDFIRTTEPRHKQRVERYVQQLLDGGDVYLGEYEGWYDAGQEEYVPEAKAKDFDFKSPINGKPLVRKKEKNYFFRLSAYQQELERLLEAGEEFSVRPAARRNEVLARVREGLNDVPISRTGAEGWGVAMPGDPSHTIYVWIDALFNYLTVVDTDELRRYWPANLHLIAKDILWFHAVIWPALLLALRKVDGNDWMHLPRCLYVHSFWIREGQKMSKSLGNFIDLEVIDAHVERFGLDTLRYFLATQGPLGTTDSDFAEVKYVEVYNSDLANSLGNCLNRVLNMTGRYFDGKVPEPGAPVAEDREYDGTAKDAAERAVAAYERCDLAGAAGAALDLVRAVDGYIHKTEPFKRIKDTDRAGEVATILYNAAEALRIATVLLWPVIPAKAEEIWRRLGCAAYGARLSETGRGEFDTWVRWGGLSAGSEVHKGDPLFPRVDVAEVLAELAPASTPSTPTPETPVPTPEPTATQTPNTDTPKTDAPAAAKQSNKPDPDAVEALAPITIDQFFDVLLRTGTIVEAEPVPKSNKLLKLQVDLGDEKRQIVAGIAKVYPPEELIGRQVVVVANLKPAKLMGVESQGMVLAASDGGKPILVSPSVEVPNGVRVR